MKKSNKTAKMNKAVKEETKDKKTDKKMNVKVVILCLIALIGLVLTFTVHWGFIIISIIIMIMNQRELMKRKK